MYVLPVIPVALLSTASIRETLGRVFQDVDPSSCFVGTRRSSLIPDRLILILTSIDLAPPRPTRYSDLQAFKYTLLDVGLITAGALPPDSSIAVSISDKRPPLAPSCY